MKIAISADGKDLESTIHERFGRCPYFLIVETDDLSVETLENANADLSTSAGIQSASLVASKGVEAVITGNCGPKAMQVFDATNIRIITGQHGKIRPVVENFKRGTLHPSTGRKRPEKTGTTPQIPARDPMQPGMAGGGRGMGGAGRGMGGGGRCMGGGGRGMGMGRRCVSPAGAGSLNDPRAFSGVSREQELASLQQQAEELKRQMQTIDSRIKDLA